MEKDFPKYQCRVLQYIVIEGGTMLTSKAWSSDKMISFELESQVITPSHHPKFVLEKRETMISFFFF